MQYQMSRTIVKCKTLLDKEVWTSMVQRSIDLTTSLHKCHVCSENRIGACIDFEGKCRRQLLRHWCYSMINLVCIYALSSSVVGIFTCAPRSARRAQAFEQSTDL